MKKHFYILLLLAFILGSCHEQEARLIPDIASKVVGSYTMTSSYFSMTDTQNPYKSGSLIISRLGADSVRGDVQIEGIRSVLFSGNWHLRPRSMTGDTISIWGRLCGCQYANKQVNMFMADGTIQLIFKKDN